MNEGAPLRAPDSPKDHLMTAERSIVSRISRRSLLKGVAAVSAVAAAGAPSRPSQASATTIGGKVLHGNAFDIDVSAVTANVRGRPVTALGYNGGIPGPILRFRQGDDITIRVKNRLDVPTSIHWHGLRVPANMDGVPPLSFPGIAAGETFTYRFKLNHSGTFWYHSHSAFQEQTGLYGAIIVDPADKDPIAYDREYIVLLSEWTEEEPEGIVSNLKFQSDYYNFGRRTVGTFFSDVARDGLAATISERLEWGRMRMTPADLSDVSGATYTYLLNGQAPHNNWTALFKPGERVRLRVINGSAMTFFDVRIPGLPMTVVQADGNDVEPVTVDEFRIGVAETYDVIVQPPDDRAYTIFAQAMDRSGYARGTLATRVGLEGQVPAMDPRPIRTMADMGMDHGAGGHAGHGGMTTGSGSASRMEMGSGGMQHGSTPGKSQGAMPGMDHGSMPGMGPGKMQGMDHGNMPGMNHGAMPGMDHSNMPGMDHGSMPGMDHGQSDMDAMAKVAAELENTPGVDNVAMMPKSRLAEAGIGLDGNGRRVLTYADLKAVQPGDDPRPPSRDIVLQLTGNMQRYVWGFDGKKFSESGPIRLKLGERVRFVLINNTMMEHPIHLHGLWSELENDHGVYRPYKHTIIVKPGERLSYLVTADEPGHWAYHCHLLYHMEMGMFRTVVVA